MHLVGYLYEDYHDARSLEHKVWLEIVIWILLAHDKDNWLCVVNTVLIVAVLCILMFMMMVTTLMMIKS
jgi:ABC-type polysaccharide transport system permease subunit